MTSVVDRAAPVDHHQMLIGGQRVDAADAATFETLDPYTGRPWAVVPEATGEDVSRAVAAARAAFEDGPWPRFTGRDRATCLRRLAELLHRDGEHLATVESRDTGKVLRETRGMLGMVPTWFDYFAGWADRVQGDVIPTEHPSFLVYTLREPVGVVAAVTAWNSPLLMAAYKLAPALAVGCTIVIKPAEQAPVSTLALGELIEEAGFPPGVVNVITGGRDVGAALVGHPGIDKVSFTGSGPTGTAVAKLAADNLVPVSLELGGKSPHIVFGDADLAAAAEGVAAGIFTATGQSCGAGSRVFVHESVAAELLDRVSRRAHAIRMGDPFDPATDMGPLSFEAHLERVLAAIDDGVARGGRLVAGGRRPTEEALADGFFVEPTILDDVDNTMPVARDEIFGPVLCVMPFSTEAEAIRLANDSRYGLAAAVWTGSVGQAHRVAQRLRAGTVWINAYRMMSAAAPWGGYKASGYGREQGYAALAEFTQTKAVWVNAGEDGP